MDVKSNLKKARDAIKNKEYEAAFKLCKAILKEDKTNYMGLVFLGVSLQEVGPTEQAANAFRKAIQVDPENSLAWNGLANFYEKPENLTHHSDDLLPVYEAILKLESNETKLTEIVRKLSNLQIEDNAKAARIIYALKDRGLPKNEIFECVIGCLRKVELLTNDLKKIYEESFMYLIENNGTTTEIVSLYLRFLYDQLRFNEVLSCVDQFSDKLDTKERTEWFSRAAVASYVRNQLTYPHQTIEAYSSSSILIKAIVLMERALLCEARDLLTEAVKKNKSPDAFALLAKCSFDLLLWNETIEAVRKAKNCNVNDEAFDSMIDSILCRSLCFAEEPERRAEGAALCIEKLKSKPDESVYLRALIECYVASEDFVEAEMNVDRLPPDEKYLYALLKSKILLAQGNPSAALKLLGRVEFEESDYYTLLGEIRKSLKDTTGSLVPFLKAAKLNPNSFVCFRNLGSYYKTIGDIDKARRCYEKSFKLNPKCTEVGIELSKAYRQQKKWEENLNLLESCTQMRLAPDTKWAYLQLGLHYLEQEDYPNAINTFRLLIRSDPENSHCWESLADAYLARGAYTSSIKSYQKAIEVKGDSLYPLLQIANIKKMLGEFVEARAAFEEVLRLESTYVPALKGLAETCLHQAKYYKRTQLIGLSRDAAQYAIEKVRIALIERADLSCLWKILGDCVHLVATLPEKFSCLMVDAAFVGGQLNRSAIVEENDLFNLATKCYSKAINLTEENVLIYHDLSNCYLSHAVKLSGTEKYQLMEKALVAVKYCVSKNPTHWQHWNLLGNVAFSHDPKDLSLAQHAFVKAVTLERNSAVAWCNLGTLYLHLGDVKLANESYARAQRGDPNYVNSWIGQAFIAESLGHEDAMDLFRHSTQLAHHQQSAIGYATWVCRTLADTPSDVRTYSIHNMHAVPVACDALTWYTENDPEDACAWNLLGLLRERMGLKDEVTRAFKRARIKAAGGENIDEVHINYGRSLVRLGEHSLAVDMYRSVKEATLNSTAGLALALFKDQQFEESYEAYEGALNWLTGNQSYMSDMLVALASMAYSFQGPDAAKNLLFQSTQMKSVSPWGLYATLSLGLLHDEPDLAELVLKELEVLKDDLTCLPHYALLMVYTCLLQGELTKAIRELSKLIHRHPDQASPWLTMSMLLLRLHENRAVTSAAGRCAQVAMRLGRDSMDVTKVLCNVSIASILTGDLSGGLRAAQNAIHCYPDVAEGWAALIYALGAKNDTRVSKTRVMARHVHTNLKPNEELTSWLEQLAY